jgi:hypothetical protein
LVKPFLIPLSLSGNHIMVAATVVMAVATMMLVWFNFQLVRVTRELHQATQAATEATKQSAKAADKSAEAAEIALHKDRPYLFSFSGRTEDILNPRNPHIPELKETIGSVSCDLENSGTGPAVISEIVARLRFGPQPFFPDPPSFADCYPIRLGQRVVPARERTNFIVLAGVHSPVEQDPATSERLSCYGIIRYTDVSGRMRYETTFGFWRDFGIKADETEARWTWVDGPESYNRFT